MIPKTEPFHWIADSQRHPIPEGLKSDSIFAKEGSANFLSQQLLYMGSLCKKVYATCFPRNWCRMAHLRKRKEKPRLCRVLTFPLQFLPEQHQSDHGRHHQYTENQVLFGPLLWYHDLNLVWRYHNCIYLTSVRKQILITEKYREAVESSPVSHPNSKPLST